MRNVNLNLKKALKPTFFPKLENLSPGTKTLILFLITIVGVSIVVALKPIPQSLAYHRFADVRTILAIPNFCNVITNLPFILIGTYGLMLLKRKGFSDAVAWPYCSLFWGLLLTGFGSAYYHCLPNDATLIFDRIPLTIIYMSFLSLTIGECINKRLGIFFLFPLLSIGISSVLWWYITETRGYGDLRFYGFVQFYPIVIIPAIAILFPSLVFKAGISSVIWIDITYLIAKLFEYFDKEVFAFTHFLSGHSLKHIAASFTAWYIIELFRRKYP